MKRFKVVQQYASVTALRSERKLQTPIDRGSYTTNSSLEALKRAAQATYTYPLLMHATEESEETEQI